MVQTSNSTNNSKSTDTIITFTNYLSSLIDETTRNVSKNTTMLLKNNLLPLILLDLPPICNENVGVTICG